MKNEIKNYFKRRSCFTLIRPVNEEEKLQYVSKLQEHELRPQFRQQIEELKSFIFKTIRPKTVNGTALNGRSNYYLC